MIRAPSQVLLLVSFSFVIFMAGCASSPKNNVPEIELVEDDTPISLQVTPTISFVFPGGTSYKRIIIRIAEHPNNALIRLEWTSVDGEGGASERTLEGTNSLRILDGTFFFGKPGPYLSRGHYVITATLHRSNGESFTVKKETEVNSDVNETRRESKRQ